MEVLVLICKVLTQKLSQLILRDQLLVLKLNLEEFPVGKFDKAITGQILLLFKDFISKRFMIAQWAPDIVATSDFFFFGFTWRYRPITY